MRKLISQNLTLSNPLKVCNLRRFVHNYILLKEKFLQKYIIWNKFPYIYPEFAVYISVIFWDIQVNFPKMSQKCICALSAKLSQN